jgi:hypothetical protein
MGIQPERLLSGHSKEEVAKVRIRRVDGKVVRFHCCPATVKGTKATGKAAISFQQSALSKEK